MKEGLLLEEEDSKDTVYVYEGDRLVSYGGADFVYDVMGNPTTYRGKAAKWEKGRNLVSYGGHTFAYDGQGRRIAKDGISFTYDSNGNLIKQSNGLEYIYDHSGVFGVTYGGETYVYRKDAQGNVIALMNASGAVVARYLYDAWGTCVVVNNSGAEIADANHIGNLNPFRYRGYYYDVETKLYYLKTRYYDPELGRFMTIDGIEYLDPETINGLNLYAYCGNNPVMAVDPNGNKWWHWLIGCLALVGGAILCFVPGGQALGVALLVSGVSITASNIMTAAGVNGKVASLISSGLNIVAGIALCFTPFAGIGASMIGSGIGGIAGGYISEALGGSFELGSIIGSVLGGIIGGKVYDGIKIAQLSKNGAVVLGEGMSRVRATAATTGAGTYGGMPGFAKLSKILPKQFMNQLGLAHNARWINWVGKAGVDIIDIGICGNNSANYLMEILHIGKWLF